VTDVSLKPIKSAIGGGASPLSMAWISFNSLGLAVRVEIQ
jgi:hypothetical protein